VDGEERREHTEFPLRHWTGEQTWEAGVRKMALEPTSDPVTAKVELKLSKITIGHYAKYWFEQIRTRSAFAQYINGKGGRNG